MLGGWEASSKYRFQSGQYLTPTGNSSIGDRRAEYVGGEIDIDGDELKWFNTAAFANPPEDRRGTATVGMIEGPAFKQMDVSFRKNFTFGGRYHLTPIFDIFNLFNTVNFGNPNGGRQQRRVRNDQRGPAAAPVPVRRPLRLLDGRATADGLPTASASASAAACRCRADCIRDRASAVGGLPRFGTAQRLSVRR